ncbi:hypothetical protein [Microcoleus phage My-WqHQDG]|nr:hypothetical protein [Microcoleus phage My-WqHQDG]
MIACLGACRTGEYVKDCDHRRYTSITLYDPHSWRNDPRQLQFDYKLKPSTVKDMLEVLQSPIGVEYWDWKGNQFLMNEDCDVHLGTAGMSGEPLTKLLLQHILGYVYPPQTAIRSWTHPYLASDRKKLQEMYKVLMPATEDTDMTPVWKLAIAMDTKVGYHSPEGYLEDFRSGRANGDLINAQLYYEDLCARLGEVPYPYKYLSGQYYHIPIIWWASDSEVVPQVGWYVDTPNDPAETTCWGLDVRVIRVKLCRDYCIDPARISHVEVTCRVAYEEG